MFERFSIIRLCECLSFWVINGVDLVVGHTECNGKAHLRGSTAAFTDYIIIWDDVDVVVAVNELSVSRGLEEVLAIMLLDSFRVFALVS